MNDPLSCPIKLPPLDGRTFVPVPPNTDLKSKSVPGKFQSHNKANSFKQALSNAKSAQADTAAAKETEKAQKAGQQMEAFLLSFVFKQAFNNSISSGLFGDSYAAHMYLEMFVDTAAEEAAKSTPLGIADMIVSDINQKRLSEEVTSNETQKLRGVRKTDADGVKGHMLSLR